MLIPPEENNDDIWNVSKNKQVRKNTSLLKLKRFFTESCRVIVFIKINQMCSQLDENKIDSK